MSKKLGDRIKLARNNVGISQKGLAKKVGLSQTAIHKLECGWSLSSRRTIAIALACGVDPIWLDSGRGDMQLSGVDIIEKTEGESQFRHFPLIARVPHIPWSLIDEMCINDDFEQIEAKANSWIPVAPRTNERCYALTVQDDSMEPEFTQREIIIVDPTQNGGHNQYIIARLQGDNNPTFKQLIDLGNSSYLKPLNTRYPLINVEGNLEICGVVVCKYKEYFPCSS
ncbi:MAG: LexA family transcriptional regulator [Magnetococcales bacterium]|nr:LexA family transcriptional regulator [Magnetococcales bacterium]